MCEEGMGAGGGFGGGRGQEERALDAVVDDEERCGGGCGAEEDGWEASVDAADCLAQGYARSLGCGCIACSLETSFDSVEGIEGTVDREACNGAGLLQRELVSSSKAKVVWKV